MRALVLFDSGFGNTEKVARAVAAGIGNEAVVVRADSTFIPVTDVNLLVVGSPTNGGRPTQRIIDFLRRLPSGGLRNVRAAAFDTRLPENEQNFLLRGLMAMIGYAAPRIATGLENAGAQRIAEPAGFIVEGREGPLREGELARATEWGRRLVGGL
jgi:flavodoxin